MFFIRKAACSYHWRRFTHLNREQSYNLHASNTLFYLIIFLTTYKPETTYCLHSTFSEHLLGILYFQFFRVLK